MRTLSVITLAVFSCLGTLQAESLAGGKKFYSDDPLWTSPKPAPAHTATRKLNEYYDFVSNTFFPTGERAARSGTYLPSEAVNTVDEVADSAWYTNRHAVRRMSSDELKTGSGNTRPPAPGKWTVVAAKNEGITPGFRIKDSAGRQYLVKFDPLSNPELASAADVITSRFFHALGYNVPENYVVALDRNQIVIGSDAKMPDAKGNKRDIREADIDEMLAKAPRGADGRYRAMASLLIDGKPIGPFQFHGTRGDDPNDLVEHEHRRDLRALRTFCAWLGHDDSKALNSLDVLTEENGTPFVKHYLIDFGASLGSASFAANSPRDGNVYLFDWKSSAQQFFTLGLYAPKWQRAKYPAIPAIGRFEYEIFDPARWVGDYPSTAFRNENPADRAWAARKIAAFTDDDIRAIVSTGKYTDPAAEEWIARCLIERRNKIVRAFLQGTAGLDGFAVRGTRLENGYVGPQGSEPSVRVRWATFDNESGQTDFLPGNGSSAVPQVAPSVRYLLAEIESSNGPDISVYIRNDADRTSVVGVERHFASSVRK
ncbi:MAG: hypothetical protein ABI759_09480 [Candidatus Solibacter sp.]